MVKLLLGRENVDPDRPDKDGYGPLGLAAFCGHEGVVKMLLGRGGVDPNRLDKHGGTPLSHASREGHARIVQLLQARNSVGSPEAPLPHQL